MNAIVTDANEQKRNWEAESENEDVQMRLEKPHLDESI
jgi:hypothetical protein